MLVWGGSNSEAFLDDGSALQGDTWSALSQTDAPSGRLFHTASWTGTEMVVFGGGVLGQGKAGLATSHAKYNPTTSTWTALSATNAPAVRSAHSMVWTGHEAIIFGGYDAEKVLVDGARYDPATDTWTPLPTTDVPIARNTHTATWTGQEMIIWGGSNIVSGDLKSGARYRP
jgi:N-acetylneuraminic acid mutarotase